LAPAQPAAKKGQEKSKGFTDENASWLKPAAKKGKIPVVVEEEEEEEEEEEDDEEDAEFDDEEDGDEDEENEDEEDDGDKEDIFVRTNQVQTLSVVVRLRSMFSLIGTG